MNNVTGKVTFDVTDWLRAAYTIGYWSNDTRSSVQSYLSDAGGHSTYGGVSGFASNNYRLDEQHLMNSLTLKTDTRGNWDGEAVFTRYDYLTDAQHTPAGVLPGKQFKTNGYIARLDGTGWSTQDVKGIWRPDGIDGSHQLSFGLHRDQYTLNNPTYTTDDWRSSSNRGTGTLYTDGKGKTETYALWAQDVWKLTPALALTLGGRLEFWRAYDGFNLAGNVAVDQPTVRSTNFSPKATLAWQIDPAWSAKLSFGQAYRYPTVSELYQIVSTGSTYAVPNPDLTPENVYSGELSIARQVKDTSLRVSFFQEDTRNALIAQTDLINNVYTTTFQNVRRTRNRGVELVVEQRNAFVAGLDLSGSITYVDSRILSDPSFDSASGTTAKGKHVPYVPAWRYTLQATYRPSEHFALSVAARYQGRMYSTLDNTDSDSKVFGAFTKFFVVDTHVHYQLNDTIIADAGIDNLFNEKYFEYHPFPGRTYVASLKLKF
jgi:iron complex outermembrane receptor protein